MEQTVELNMPELLSTPDKIRVDGHDYVLITKASDEFDRGNYDSCIDILEQLEEFKNHDIKLEHNKSVAIFYNGNCRDYMSLLKYLQKLDTKEYTSEKDIVLSPLSFFTTYNKAVIYYHRHMYKAALDVMEPLFNKINTYDENVLAMLGILELRLLLASNQPKKAYFFLEEFLHKLGINILHITSDDCNIQESLPRLDDNLGKGLKLMSLLTQVVNKKPVLVPEDVKKSFAEKLYPINGGRNLLSNRVSYTENSQSSAVLEPTMEFAALSLRNALTLTQSFLTKLDVSQNDECISSTLESHNWRTITDNNFCPPSRPVTKQTFCILLSSIYAAYSYVSLRLGDYVTALEMAEKLLKTESLSDAHKMLAHMYAGEAFIMMNKLSDARSHLELTSVSNLNIFDFETKDWQVKSVDAAQNIVRYNLAVAIFLQGDAEMARNLLNTCTHPIVSQKVSTFKKLQTSMAPASATSTTYFTSRI
ncbi:CCR4-NOT transcription complex subunit 10 [Lucilia cuprina]|nr:CCR4-NOT transcription complex subunit 10 [Lucilia cuprina]